MAREGGALAEETASRAAAALAHFPGGDSWKKILADFAAEQKRKDMAWPGIAALILSGSEADIMRAAAKAQSTDLAMIRTPEEAYMYIPGLVLAETKTGTRGKYHDLLQTLERIPVVTCDDLALVMAAAVESMEWMDQAVYEVYRGFQSVFEADFARFAEESSTDPKAPVSDAAILFSSYAVLKACRLGAVLTEKFAGQAEKNCAKMIPATDLCTSRRLLSTRKESGTGITETTGGRTEVCCGAEASLERNAHRSCAAGGGRKVSRGQAV